MGPTYPGMPPCWERPGCLSCWLFCECYNGKLSDGRRCHPENKRRARQAARALTKFQLRAVLEQERCWTYEDRLWPVPSEEEAEEMYREGRLPPRKEGETVAPGEPRIKKAGEPNLEKAKTRFRAAAWWFFGAVLGLIGGKFFVDFVVYMGMPLKPTGPEKVWSMFMWVALVAVYVCLFGALWMGLSILRRRFSLKTSYDMSVGDVRIIKVHPDINDKLLTYEPSEKPEQIEMIAEAITTADGGEIKE